MPARHQDGWCNRRPGFRKEVLPPTEESPDVDRAEKKAAIESLNGVFKASNVVVVAHYSGLTVAQMQTSAQADAGRLAPP